MKQAKEQLKIKLQEVEIEKESLEDKIKHFELPDRIMKEFETGFGFPRISQELGLEEKLGKETYTKLYNEIKIILNKIIGMIPEYEKTKRPCQVCKKVKKLVE